jgi:glycopeptide antibiotics resistance protein
MDFVGAISREIFDISWYWWIVLVLIMTGTWIWRRNKVETLLVGYFVLILIVTLFNRPFTVMEPQLKLFWSYGKPEYVSEVLLNYILFIPLGVLISLRIKTGNVVSKSWLFAVAMSLSIEILQFVFNRGLFEFDDVLGNSIGCLIGAGSVGLVRRMKKIADRGGR